MNEIQRWMSLCLIPKHLMAHLCNRGSVMKWPPQESAGVETSCVSIPGGLGPDLQCKHQGEGMSPQPQWTMSPHPSSPLSSPPTISWEHRACVIHHCIITIFQVNWGWVNKGTFQTNKKANLSNLTVCSCRSKRLDYSDFLWKLFLFQNFTV